MNRNQAQQLSFLGQEFILWLYWRSSTDSYFHLDNFDVQNIDLFLEEEISLESVLGDGFSQTIRTKEITEQQDIKESIRSGRIPRSVRIRIERGSLQWQFMLQSEPLNIKQVKFPYTNSESNDEAIYSRLMLMEELDNIMRALFATFLLERTNETFISDIKEFLELGE